MLVLNFALNTISVQKLFALKFIQVIMFLFVSTNLFSGKKWITMAFIAPYLAFLGTRLFAIMVSWVTSWKVVRDRMHFGNICHSLTYSKSRALKTYFVVRNIDEWDTSISNIHLILFLPPPPFSVWGTTLIISLVAHDSNKLRVSSGPLPFEILFPQRFHDVAHTYKSTPINCRPTVSVVKCTYVQ